MKVNQLSVFIENKTGRINDVTSILAASGINISAFCIAESSDFGIMRIVVADSERAKNVLKENGFAVTSTEVVCLNCPNTTGSLDKVLKILAKQGIFIEYMYAFSQGLTASVVIKPTDIKRCIEVLLESRLELISEDKLYDF